MFFKNLPDEITLLIFNKVSPQNQARLAQVDKYCHAMSHDKTLDLAAYKKNKLPLELKAAVLAKNIEKIKFFLAIGADPNHIYDVNAPVGLSDKDHHLGGLEKTLLHFTICSGSYDVASFLIKNKANVNLTNGYNTPLHSAAFWLRAKIAKLLIDNGADINALNCAGYMPAFEVRRGYALGDHEIENLINALEYSLRTNTNWDAAISAEEQRDIKHLSIYGKILYA